MRGGEDCLAPAQMDEVVEDGDRYAGTNLEQDHQGPELRNDDPDLAARLAAQLEQAIPVRDTQDQIVD